MKFFNAAPSRSQISNNVKTWFKLSSRVKFKHVFKILYVFLCGFMDKCLNVETVSYYFPLLNVERWTLLRIINETFIAYEKISWAICPSFLVWLLVWNFNFIFGYYILFSQSLIVVTVQGDCCFKVYCNIYANFYFFSCRPNCTKISPSVHTLVHRDYC